jgi:hypothetical protein
MNPGLLNYLNRQEMARYRGRSMTARCPTDLAGGFNGAAIADRELESADNDVLSLARAPILVHETGWRPPDDPELS